VAMRDLRAAAVAVLLGALLPGGVRSADVVRLRLEGPIHAVTAEYLKKGIEEAPRTGAQAVLLVIDTPGGFVSAVEEIQRAILLSPLPVVAYVSPVNARAASGGALVALSADFIAMAPGTTIGSAHPVSALPFSFPTAPEKPGEPEKKETPQRPASSDQEVMLEKILNDLSAHARTLAEHRGRDGAVYERMLRESVSLTEKEALNQRAIELVAASEAEIWTFLSGRSLRRFDGREVDLRLGPSPETVEVNPTLRQRLLSGLANPNLTLVLLLVGVVGLYAEFKAPGLILPGVLGGICILLFALSTQLLPINAVGLLLILLGIAFLLLELKVASYGILGTGGVVSLLIGSLLLYRNSPVPELRVSLLFVLPVVLAFAAILFFLVALAVKAHRNPVATGEESLVGMSGEVREAIRPPAPGKVFLFGEYWNAVSDQPIEAGTRVKVLGRDGMVLKVAPAGEGG